MVYQKKIENRANVRSPAVGGSWMQGSGSQMAMAKGEVSSNVQGVRRRLESVCVPVAVFLHEMMAQMGWPTPANEVNAGFGCV